LKKQDETSQREKQKRAHVYEEGKEKEKNVKRDA